MHTIYTYVQTLHESRRCHKVLSDIIIIISKRLPVRTTSQLKIDRSDQFLPCMPSIDNHKSDCHQLNHKSNCLTCSPTQGKPMACLQMLMKASRETPKDLPSDMEFLQVMLCCFSHKQPSCHAGVMHLLLFLCCSACHGRLSCVTPGQLCRQVFVHSCVSQQFHGAQCTRCCIANLCKSLEMACVSHVVHPKHACVLLHLADYHTVSSLRMKSPLVPDRPELTICVDKPASTVSCYIPH